LQRAGAKSGRLFGNIEGRRLQEKWTKVREAAGCPDLQLRDARRTFASYGLSLGLSLAQVGELLHHTDTQTTKGYSYLIDDLKQKAAAQIASAMTEAARQ
jgi:integrase